MSFTRTKESSAEKKPCVLCLDPSLTAFGWAVLRGTTVVAHGCIKTTPNANKTQLRKADDRTARVSRIVMILKGIIEQNEVKAIFSELPHGSQSAVAATALGLVTGAVVAIADILDVPIEWYSEGDSKMALLNKRSATKGETLLAIQKKYTYTTYKTAYIDEAVADALSIHYCASLSSPMLKLLIR